MDELLREITAAAERAVSTSRSRGGGVLDYSEAGLTLLEEILNEVSVYTSDCSPRELQLLVEDFGCYLLEVARQHLGGAYYWHERQEQPVLVVGEPQFRIAMLAWDHVRGRLSGDPANDVVFLYEGFAGRVRRAQPGDDVLYV